MEEGQNRENPDVVVVGAGPSGCAAAITLARNSLKVLLIDRHELPREKICGDCITPNGLNYLEKIGALQDVLSEGLTLKGVKIVSGGISENKTEFKSLDYNRKFAVVIPRKNLDYILVKQAHASGVAVWQNTKAVKIELDRDNYNLILKNSGKHLKVTAPVVILSTGGSTELVNKFVGLNPKDYRAIGVAIRCYAETASVPPHYMHIIADDNLWPAMGWIFPVNATTVNIGMGFYIDEKDKIGRPLSDAFNYFLNESELVKNTVKLKRVLERPRALKLLMGGIKNFNQVDSFVLCGEAAGLVNPFTGEGIGLALKSGIIAGEIVARHLNDANFNRRKMCREYYDELSREFDLYFKTATFLKRIASSRFVTKNVIRLLNLFPYLSRLNIKFWTQY